MLDPYIGQICMFAGNYAPSGWALCNGQLLSIASNTALFSLLGTYYGGNGQTTFALPNLQGRLPLSAGQGPGLSDYSLGQPGGTETVTLLTQQMAMHTHTATGDQGVGNNVSPSNNFWAASSRRDSAYTGTPTIQMSPDALGLIGGGQPHTNMQPYLVVNYIIALQGIYPPRS